MARLHTLIRQQQIIEAALALIREGGVTNLTIKGLAAKVKISEQAIYRHFDNKLAIIKALIVNFNQTLSNKIRTSSPPEMIIPKIKHIISVHLEYFAEFPEMASLVYPEEVFRAEPVIREGVEETIERRIQTITEMIQKAQDEGSINESYSPENLALIIFGAVRILVTNWRFSGFSFDLIKRGETLNRDLCAMIQVKQ